jgi:hypothetical protein
MAVAAVYGLLHMYGNLHALQAAEWAEAAVTSEIGEPPSGQTGSV